MSELHLNDFVAMCDCYLQFLKEYPCDEPQEAELSEFCQFVIANKPFSQLTEQLQAFVVKHREHLVRGITVETEGIPEAGDIFEQGEAQIEIDGAGGKHYVMNFAYLCWTILERNKGRKDTDRRKLPSDVCLYCVSVISKCLRAAVIDSDLSKKDRDSIERNTQPKEKLDKLQAPYSQMSLENLRKLGSKLITRFTPTVDNVFGEGMAPKLATAVMVTDATKLMNGNLGGDIIDAVTRADDVALENVVKGVVVNVVREIHKSTDRGDPDEQI